MGLARRGSIRWWHAARTLCPSGCSQARAGAGRGKSEIPTICTWDCCRCRRRSCSGSCWCSCAWRLQPSGWVGRKARKFEGQIAGRRGYLQGKLALGRRVVLKRESPGRLSPESCILCKIFRRGIQFSIRNGRFAKPGLRNCYPVMFSSRCLARSMFDTL